MQIPTPNILNYKLKYMYNVHMSYIYIWQRSCYPHIKEFYSRMLCLQPPTKHPKSYPVKLLPRAYSSVKLQRITKYMVTHRLFHRGGISHHIQQDMQLPSHTSRTKRQTGTRWYAAPHCHVIISTSSRRITTTQFNIISEFVEGVNKALTRSLNVSAGLPV